MTKITSPVIAGHRGFKANYVENSFYGFTKCFETGATVLETDLWLCTDGEIVISHDVNTKRLFKDENGTPVDLNILQSSYETDLKHLTRIGCDEPIMTFRELLEWYIKNDTNVVNGELNRLMLDIKMPNPTKIMKTIVQTILQVENDISFWKQRIQFGIWHIKFIKYLNQQEFFRETTNNQQLFDIINISASWQNSLNYILYNQYAQELTKNDGVFRFKTTGVSLLYMSTWNTEFLEKFMPLLKIENMSLYQWTVNTKFQYDYCAKIAESFDLREYGLITDHPDTMMKYKTAGVDSNTISSPGDVHVTCLQKIAYFIFQIFISFNFSTNLIPTSEFATHVNEDEVLTPKFNRLGAYLFMTCQRFGIF